MPLPLLIRTAESDARFILTPKLRAPAPPAPERMPARLPEAGEQYRFHFDMGRCIGCKCCVVACNEQNGNPATINWRRVGEVEGGFFPKTNRGYLSMGCNHCVNPTCLEGCPVDAYTKDTTTGIVHHSADTCIGCQYCTWNCSYGVPQYNAERGVVGKCDMCHGRLSMGQAPACVGACPEGAIAIEIVNLAEWRARVTAAAPGTGHPSDDASLSTTRLTMSPKLPPDARPLALTNVTPEHAHWSLVFMTVLTQLSVGAFVAIWVLQLTGRTTHLTASALTALTVAGLALGGATLHLGRPAHAYRALRMWRRSWLSREVALFGAFSAVAALYAGVIFLGLPGGALVGGLTSLLGIAGVTASACIYRVPSRPAWNTPFTLVQFNLTAGALGPLLVAAAGATDARWPALVAAGMAGLQLLLLVLRFLRLVSTRSIELRGTLQLLSTTFRPHLVVRAALLALGGVVLPAATGDIRMLWVALLLALTSELAGRYLFFVSAVPKHMTTPYLEMGSLP
ncbi:MAG: DmsC/YnfH family molybdoenzyme membrane anchor subunit [Vicinamibacterales bacterium]|nr:DmsC/YnfH family molybdoenzyme membrane anchor subunit [Vicinamibacterales bacterium]